MMNSKRHWTLAVFVMTVLLGVPLRGQEQPTLTFETMRDPALFQAFSVPRVVAWLDDNTAVIYDVRKPDSLRTLERLDPATGTRSPFVDRTKAAQSFKALFSDGAPQRFNPVPSAITGSGAYGLYLIGGDIYVLDIPAATFIRVTQTPESEKSVTFSPDGRKLAYVRGTDLFAYDITQRKEYRLTFDGTKTLLNGTLSWVYWEEIFGRRDIGYWWSGDSRAVAYLQSDESMVSVQHYVDITPWTPTVTEQRYPKVGEKNPVVRVGVVELGADKTVWAQIPAAAFEYVMRVNWLPDSKQFCVRTLNRLQTELSLYFVDRIHGAARLVTTDADSGWINITDDLYFLNDGKHFLMSSERDGYTHLYRFTNDGKLVNQITKGSWSLRSSGGMAFWVQKAVAGIDERGGWIYYTSLEQSLLERQLYRIRFDGSGKEQLTKERGTHAITMSPNTQYFFDRFSNISTAPSLALFRANGKNMLTLAEPDDAGFKKYGVAYADLVQIPARDGFLLPASITKPKVLESGKKYPVIIEVYGGPSAPTVSNAFSYSAIKDNVYANEGYVSVKVDNRASTGISKTLENLLLYRALGEVELNDLVDAVAWLKKQPYIDPDRVGITGWSGGGSNTILAMTRSKEFKAGIAGAGVTDFRFYDSKWGEAMMRTEKENLKGYDDYSLLKYAKDLHGKLLIVHATHDDNVHIQNTWRFVDELIKANKLFELMVYPMRSHGVGDPVGQRHLNTVEFDFWKRNL
jgi:dipeptidyl-peptidase-4